MTEHMHRHDRGNPAAGLPVETALRRQFGNLIQIVGEPSTIDPQCTPFGVDEMRDGPSTYDDCGQELKKLYFFLNDRNGKSPQRSIY